MKTTLKLLTGTVVLAVLTLTTGRVQAQMTNVITLTATSLSQEDSSNDGTTTTTLPPVKTSVNMKMLLGFLARDEFAEGNYGATNFPAGAKLVVIDHTNNSAPVFQVLTSTNTFLVDVSDIVSARDGFLHNDIYSGKQNNATGLPSTKFTDLHVLTISFDDSDVPDFFGDVVGLKFYMTGLMTTTATLGRPNAAGVSTLTQTSKMPNAAGEGNYQGHPFVITGTLGTLGKLAITLP